VVLTEGVRPGAAEFLSRYAPVGREDRWTSPRPAGGEWDRYACVYTYIHMG